MPATTISESERVSIEQAESAEDVLAILERGNWRDDNNDYGGPRLTHKLVGTEWFQNGPDGEKNLTKDKQDKNDDGLQDHLKIIEDLKNKGFSIVLNESSQVKAGTETAKADYGQKIHATIYILKRGEIEIKTFEGTQEDFKKRFEEEVWMQDLMDDDDPVDLSTSQKNEQKLSLISELGGSDKNKQEVKSQNSAWEEFWQNLLKPKAEEQNQEPEQKGFLELFGFQDNNQKLEHAIDHAEPLHEQKNILDLFAPVQSSFESQKVLHEVTKPEMATATQANKLAEPKIFVPQSPPIKIKDSNERIITILNPQKPTAAEVDNYKTKTSEIKVAPTHIPASADSFVKAVEKAEAPSNGITLEASKQTDDETEIQDKEPKTLERQPITLSVENTASESSEQNKDITQVPALELKEDLAEPSQAPLEASVPASRELGAEDEGMVISIVATATDKAELADKPEISLELNNEELYDEYHEPEAVHAVAPKLEKQSADSTETAEAVVITLKTSQPEQKSEPRMIIEAIRDQDIIDVQPEAAPAVEALAQASFQKESIKDAITSKPKKKDKIVYIKPKTVVNTTINTAQDSQEKTAFSQATVDALKSDNKVFEPIYIEQKIDIKDIVEIADEAEEAETVVLQQKTLKPLPLYRELELPTHEPQSFKVEEMKPSTITHETAKPIERTLLALTKVVKQPKTSTNIDAPRGILVTPTVKALNRVTTKERSQSTINYKTSATTPTHTRPISLPATQKNYEKASIQATLEALTSLKERPLSNANINRQSYRLTKHSQEPVIARSASDEAISPRRKIASAALAMTQQEAYFGHKANKQKVLRKTFSSQEKNTASGIKPTAISDSFDEILTNTQNQNSAIKLAA